MARPTPSRTARQGPELLGILLIVLGAWWLLANSGLLPPNVWGYAWPIILIAIGVGVLLAWRPGTGTGRATVARQAATTLRLRVNFGGGQLGLSGGAAELVEVSSTRPDIRAEERRDGSAAAVRVRQDQPGIGWFRGPTAWDVRLPSDLPVELDLSAGAGEFRLDLAAIRVVRAQLSVGAAHTRLVLPRPSGEVPVAVSMGAASLEVAVPAGVQARVVTGGALVTLAGPAETAGWAAAADRVTVSVSGGVSSVTVVPA